MRLLSVTASYVAVMADDMLAMEKIYLARQLEGMNDTSRCKACRSGEVQPVATSARKQQLGCEWRAVPFFCLECGSVHDGVDQEPDPPCPVPDEVRASMRKFLAARARPLRILEVWAVRDAQLLACSGQCLHE